MEIVFKKVIIIAVICIITALFVLNLKNCLVYASDTNKYKILVDVEESKLYLLEDGKKIKEYMCSGGRKSTPSPIGTWKITKKAKWGEGFGGFFMELNVPWGTFGIHGTLNDSSIGWASSHRMYQNEK